MERVPFQFILGVLAGAIAATAVCLLTLKWPVTCSVDGTLFWAAVGATGAIATGVGAVYASRRATEIAARQAEYVEHKGKNRARIVAALVRSELTSAQSRISILRLVQGSFKGIGEDFIRLLRPFVIDEPKLSLEYALELDSHPDGDLVAQAIARTRDLGQMLDAIKKLDVMKDNEDFDHVVEKSRELLSDAIEEADIKLTGAINVLPEDVR